MTSAPHTVICLLYSCLTHTHMRTHTCRGDTRASHVPTDAYARTHARARAHTHTRPQTSTREGIAKKVGKWGVTYEVIAELKFDLPASYDFHKKSNVVIQVDLVRLAVPDAWRGAAAPQDPPHPHLLELLKVCPAPTVL